MAPTTNRKRRSRPSSSFLLTSLMILNMAAIIVTVIFPHVTMAWSTISMRPSRSAYHQGPDQRRRRLVQLFAARKSPTSSNTASSSTGSSIEGSITKKSPEKKTSEARSKGSVERKQKKSAATLMVDPLLKDTAAVGAMTGVLSAEALVSPPSSSQAPKGTKKKSSTKSKKDATETEVTTQHDQLVDELYELIMERFQAGMSNQNLLQEEDEEEGTTTPRRHPNHEHSAILNSVVRIYCTHAQPNPATPWQRLRQDFSTSTGFVIDGKHILTNAHAVEYGSLIQVKKRQSEKKYCASVVAVGHECDLALLKVDEPSFWDELKPLGFGSIPDLQEDVSVIGYPVGGDSISISSGVVSRIEMQEYAQASAELLAIQIDAAINPGNSGGPVLNDANKVIGVAFQSLSEEDIENIGYVVPVNVIHHFLDDVERHGSYSGVCSLGARLQPMENEQLRRHFGVVDQQAGADSGVLVVSIAPTAPAYDLLKKGDVVLAVDGVKIANDGSIPFREGGSAFKERVHMSYYFTQRFPSDTVSISILRAGQRLELTVPLWVPQRLVPRTLLQKNYVNVTTNAGTGTGGSIVGGVPSYLMVGGMVLLPLSKEYIDAEWNFEHMHDVVGWAESFRILSLADTMQREKDEEVVILSQVIAHSCNIGYETYKNMMLTKFNDMPVRNLRHLKEMLDRVAAGWDMSLGGIAKGDEESSGRQSGPRDGQNSSIAHGGVTIEADVSDNNPGGKGGKGKARTAKAKAFDAVAAETSARAVPPTIVTTSNVDSMTTTGATSMTATISTADVTGTRSAAHPSLVFEFSNGVVMVLDALAAFASQDQICKEHFIPQFCSNDLL